MLTGADPLPLSLSLSALRTRVMHTMTIKVATFDVVARSDLKKKFNKVNPPVPQWEQYFDLMH